MRVFHFHRRQHIQMPLREVFEFFSKPENLARITPVRMGFVILTPSPIPMRTGTLIDYELKVAGIPIHWRTLITNYEPPYSFVDEQLKGPYTFWHHTHRFVETENGTVMTDEVHYALPFGILGVIAHALFVRRQLRMIFDYRQKAIEEFLSVKGFQQKHLEEHA